MADPSFTSLQVAVVGMLSRKYGWDFYEKLRKNDIMLVPGNQQVSDIVKRGERLVAVGADASYVADIRKQRALGSDDLSAGRCLHHSVAELGGEGFAAS